MIFKGFVAVLFLLLAGGFALSQEISHQVLVPAASVVLKGNINYQQTLGEPIIEIVSADDKVLTQGFQQKRFAGKIYIPDGTGVDSYPNPVDEYVNVKIWGEFGHDLKIYIFNFQGVMLYNTERSFSGPYFEVIEVNVADYKPGIYFIKVISTDNVIYRAFKFEKM